MSAAAQWSSSRDARPRFRLTAPEPSELDLHAAVASTLHTLVLPPAMWWTNPIGHIQLSGAQMARLARIGTKAGLPDIFLLHGGLYGIEIKRHGGSLSKTRIAKARTGALRIVEGQQDVFPRLVEAGAAEVAVVTSLDELLAALGRWGIPLRHALVSVRAPSPPAEGLR
jgi:hypothetical protein